MTTAYLLHDTSRYFYTMKVLPLIVLFVLICLKSNSYAADKPYQQLLKDRFAFQAQEVFIRYKLSPPTRSQEPTSVFPRYDSVAVDQFLKAKFGNYYDGYHPLIEEYIHFFSSQPHQHLKTWFGLHHYFSPKWVGVSQENHDVLNMLALSQVQAISFVEHETIKPPFNIPAPIAIYFGCEVTAHVDNSRLFEFQLKIADKYLTQLNQKFLKKSFALGALICSAATVNKALAMDDLIFTYWDLYPYMASTYRDFYPALLAASFVLSKQKDWRMDGFVIEENTTHTSVVVYDTIHLAQIATVLNIESKALISMNPQYIKKIVLPTYSLHLPLDKVADFNRLKDSIYQYNRETYFPSTLDSCYVFYRTKSGDYFRDLIRWFGVDLEEIKRLNGFTSNTLKKDWDVFFKVACEDSALVASFDKLARNQKDALARGEAIPEPKVVEPEKPHAVATTPVSGQKITYTVKSGDSLWGIGQKHKVSDQDIMRWNNIDSRIQPGQKLIIYLP